MTDYTNDRWTVNGLIVTHKDFPGMNWDLALGDNAEGHASQPPNRSWTHAARAWLAAQPKPAPKVGMRIEATLKNGTVVRGGVAATNTYEGWTSITFAALGSVYLRHDGSVIDYDDLTSWHEVTA